MKLETSTETALVSLPISLIEALLTMRSALDEDVADALRSITGCSQGTSKVTSNRRSSDVIVPQSGKYAAEFLGTAFFENTLAAIFGRAVDMMAEVAPEALVSLATIRTRGRRFISLEPHDIHPFSPHLPVMRTESGWWISKNISRDQLKLALRELCEVAELSFGKDLKFPLERPQSHEQLAS